MLTWRGTPSAGAVGLGGFMLTFVAPCEIDRCNRNSLAKELTFSTVRTASIAHADNWSMTAIIGVVRRNAADMHASACQGSSPAACRGSTRG